MKQDTRILIGLSIIFIVLIGISTAIYFNSLDLSCDACTIEFKNTEVLGIKLDQPIIISVDATELYNNLINNSCLVRWSRTDGYIYYGN